MCSSDLSAKKLAKSWTDNAPQPKVLQDHAHLRDSISYRIKRKLLGNPLNRHTLSHQRLSKRYALGVLSSDCISSSAYGSEQILRALLPAFGLAAFSILLPMTIVVLIVLVIVTFSYREVVSIYTKSGGAYVVSRDNLNPLAAQLSDCRAWSGCRAGSASGRWRACPRSRPCRSGAERGSRYRPA